jgi:membrane-bound lytic murein transglycosylase D
LTEEEKKVIDKEADKVDESTTIIEKAPIRSADKYIYHTVAPGDTLFSIAKRYEGITVEQLKSLNKIKNTHNLKPGTKLKVKVQA